MAKKKSAPRPAAKKPARKPAVKPKAKPAPKPASRKVTARPPSGKMLRKATPSRPVKVAEKKRSPAPARPKPAKPVKAARPAAPPKKVVVPATRAPARAPARSSRKAAEERRALPHKVAVTPSFSFGDYFESNAGPYPTLPPSRKEVLPVAVEWKERMRPGELYQAFKRFFEANEIGNRLVPTLREGAAAILEFEGDPQIYKVVKVRGRALFEAGRPASAEVYAKFSRHAVEALLAPNALKPTEYVQRFVELASDSDPVKRIEVKLLSTHGEAIRKGYLGIVAAGGRALAEGLQKLHFALPSEFVRQLK